MAAYLALGTPDMLVRAQLFRAAFEAAEQSSAALFSEELDRVDPWLLVAVLAIAAPATFFVHSTHLKLLIKWHGKYALANDQAPFPPSFFIFLSCF